MRWPCPPILRTSSAPLYCSTARSSAGGAMPAQATIAKLIAECGLEAPAWMPTSLAFEVLAGSESYGCALPGGSSDCDIVGVAVPPQDIEFPHLMGHVAGFGPPPAPFHQWQKQPHRSAGRAVRPVRLRNTEVLRAGRRKQPQHTGRPVCARSLPAALNAGRRPAARQPARVPPPRRLPQAQWIRQIHGAQDAARDCAHQPQAGGIRASARL